MARRKSVAEDILDITTTLPWWAGVLLAVFSYLILHAVAGLQLTPASDMASAGRQLPKQVVILAAGILQYLLPFLFGLGSLGSIFIHRKKKALYGNLRANPQLQTLRELNWRQFELLVGQYFEKQGFSIRQRAQPGPDGGVDVVIFREKEKYLVQCKQWRATQVGVPIVRELMGAIATQGATGGYVVTSGTFTKPALDFAKNTNIHLIDGALLVRKISPETFLNTANSEREECSPVVGPECPVCGSAMVKRTARRGSSAGNAFWGCSHYPECKGARSLS